MNDTFNDKEINDFITKYPLEKQSLIAWKLVKIGIRYINKNTRTYRPLTVKELDTMISNLDIPRPPIQSLFPQKKFPDSRVYSSNNQSYAQTFEINGIEEEPHKRPLSVIHQKKDNDIFSHYFNRLSSSKKQGNKDNEAKMDLNTSNKQNEKGSSIYQRKTPFNYADKQEYCFDYDKDNDHLNFQRSKMIQIEENKHVDQDSRGKKIPFAFTKKKPKIMNNNKFKAFELVKNKYLSTNLNRGTNNFNCSNEIETKAKEVKNNSLFDDKKLNYNHRNNRKIHTSSTEPSILYSNSFRESSTLSDQCLCSQGADYNVNRRHWN